MVTLACIVAVILMPPAMVFTLVFIIGGFMDEETARELQDLLRGW